MDSTRGVWMPSDDAQEGSTIRFISHSYHQCPTDLSGTRSVEPRFLGRRLQASWWKRSTPQKGKINERSRNCPPQGEFGRRAAGLSEHVGDRYQQPRLLPQGC